jgi:hypothetical protein
MKKVPLKDIDDRDEFWTGAVFRKNGTTVNITNPEEDFYEYMLFHHPGNSKFLLCAHIDKWEQGTVVAYVKCTGANNRITVSGREFKRSMVLPEEMDNWYFLDIGIRQTRIKAIQISNK